ncbi:MAG: pilus assembly protein PilO [Cyanobacteria bacterium P01_A01_bin.84]
MTLSEDLDFVDGGGELEEGSSNYPVVFGITFTPQVSGILIAVVGIAGAAYMVMNLIMPTLEVWNQQKAKQTQLQQEIQSKKDSLNSIDKVKKELAQTKQQQLQVLSVFADEKTLDTLLLDLNRWVVAGNDLLPANAVKAKLKKFVPDGSKPQPITDGSFGAQVDGKLKSTSINVDIVGTYDQTQSIIRNVERLKPLLIVKNYKSTLDTEPVDKDGKFKRRVGGAPIKTSFTLQALVPMNPDEIKAAMKAQQEAQE